MEKKQKSKGGERRSSARAKVFSTNVLQMSEHDASNLVGGIVEKGISDTQQNKLFASIAPPKPSVLPFPVARHRSHGPHWDTVGSRKGGDCTNDVDIHEDGEEDKSLLEFDPIAPFANPLQRKEKKGLEFSRWIELVSGSESSTAQEEGHKVPGLKRTENQRNDLVIDTVEKINMSCELSSDDVDVPSPEMANAPHLKCSQLDDKRMSQDIRVPEVLRIKEHQTLNFPSSDPNIIGSEAASISLENQIDEENRARLQGMSPDEIAEAQAELMEKINPVILEALKKRGEDKLKKLRCSAGVAVDYISSSLQKEEILDVKGSCNSEDGIYHKMTTQITSKDTQVETENGLVQGPGTGSLWNAWSARVEAVRSLRFSLEGNIIESDFDQISKAGEMPVNRGHRADDVTERDFLRTEGDPGASGYTIKEAVALTRSVIPGQRTLGLCIISSVLDKALRNILKKKVGSTMVKSGSSIDWEAVWAFALGPEPELVLSLRMCLDNNHKSVVLACAKVIQSVLSCDANENFFNILEKSATYDKYVYTAPVFRSKPDVDAGFLPGGFWKHNAKHSNILMSEDGGNDETEREHTIQDDIVVAGQDFAAGLIRMGVLPRLCYLLEADPSTALEESIISILLAIARHSPTCANAIVNCHRLIQTVIHRFMMEGNIKIHPSKIKSVTLLKVLARSDRKYCIDYIKNGTFQVMTWHLYKYSSSIDHWVKSGRDHCRLSSALIVEQLRLWKVCIQYGQCVSYFSDIFPALCMWLSPPTFEKLVENNVLHEFASISTEAYLVMEALSRRLPNFFSQDHLKSPKSDLAGDGTEIWSWSTVVPIIDLAVKWIVSRSDPFISKLFNTRKGIKADFVFEEKSLTPILWIYSAVLKMLSQVLHRLTQKDGVSLHESGDVVPWLPEFVPRVGLEIIKNGFLSFAGANDALYGQNHAGSSSFIEELCRLRQQSGFETSLASVSCLYGLVQMIVAIDLLIKLAKTGNYSHPPVEYSLSREGEMLKDGIVKGSFDEFRTVLNIFTTVIASECHIMQSIETFGRGGPAPGVGIGWGASGGGYWSPTVLLAQIDAGLLVSLFETLQIVSVDTRIIEETFTIGSVNSALAACSTLGPRDTVMIEKAFKFLLQAPILKYLGFYIRSFLHNNERLKQSRGEYGEEDYRVNSKILYSHFRDRWLSVKKTKAMEGKISSGTKTFKEGNVSLGTIYEDSDASSVVGQCSTSLTVEWARQRLPIPVHWFLSPITTTNYRKHAGDLLDVAKSGLFFLLGIEALSTFLPNDVSSPVQSVPLIWKLHSLSVTLLVGMDVLEDDKSRDNYEALQDLFGQHLDRARCGQSYKLLQEKNAKFLLPESHYYNNVEFLRFQSEIHDSYPTFIENLVEQFSAVSYGDILYGRQVALYLHRNVEGPVRLATWNALTTARVLELLPPLGKCISGAEGYLQPIEDNEAILEAYVKSWVSGALDRAATRGSVSYTLVLHHLSSYIFQHPGDKSSLRNKLVRSLLRDYSRKQQHQGFMLDFILYTNLSTSHMPEQENGSPLEMSVIERRLEVLKEACERNSGLLTEVDKLGSLVTRKLSVIHSSN